MVAKNDITGDTIKSKGPSNAYEDGWCRIFGKKNYTDHFPNDKQFGDDIICKKCRFKQQKSKEPPVLICQSCGELL